MLADYNDTGGESAVRLPVTDSPYKFKKLPYGKVCMVAPHSEQEVPVNVPVLLCDFFSTIQDVILVMLHDPHRV
jgi:hypothetical protein